MFLTSLIIPTYNEAKNLPILVKEIFDTIDKKIIDLEIIFVDDNSPDNTGKIAEDLSKNYPIKVLHRSGKFGLGSAVREGFSLSNRPILGVMDADLSHDPSIINSMILSLAENDLAAGSRFEVESSTENWSLRRKIISNSGVLLARLLTGKKDALSGYFFLRREVIDGVDLKTVGYKILLEILVKGKYKKVKEFPYTFRMRKFSTSKLNYKEFILFFGQILSYSFFKIFKFIKYGK